MAEWHSERWRQEQSHNDMVKIFDDFIDLALDGVVTMEQAIEGIREVIATEAEVSGTIRRNAA